MCDDANQIQDLKYLRMPSIIEIDCQFPKAVS